MRFAVADPILSKLNEADQAATLRLKGGYITEGYVENYDEEARRKKCVEIVHPSGGSAQTCQREVIDIKDILSIQYGDQDYTAIEGRR
jgi:hypothetical protein